MCDVVVEWTSPINRVVDTNACYKQESGVKDCLRYVPGPPLYKPLKQERGRDQGEMLGTRQPSAEQLAEARRAYRFDLCVVFTVSWFFLTF